LPAFARVYERRGPPFWLSPLADPATALRLTVSAVRPSRTWRGRSYPC
jgi:dolichol-phosphate mannosyltransferase